MVLPLQLERNKVLHNLCVMVILCIYARDTDYALAAGEYLHERWQCPFDSIRYVGRYYGRCFTELWEHLFIIFFIGKVNLVSLFHGRNDNGILVIFCFSDIRLNDFNNIIVKVTNISNLFRVYLYYLLSLTPRYIRITNHLQARCHHLLRSPMQTKVQLQSGLHMPRHLEYRRASLLGM